MTTAVARQLKLDDPDCHITWAISYKCRQVIENNPDIDNIWEVQYSAGENQYTDVLFKVKAEAEKKRMAGEYDEIICGQMSTDNIQYFDGTTRSSTFRTFGKPIKDVTPIINLYDYEIKHVKEFAEKHDLKKYRNVVLCECSPSSRQSFMTLPLMLELVEGIVKELDDVVFIISTHLKVQSNNKRIIDGSMLSFRENAELSKYCTMLIGCSSGITWLLTSNWAKKINTIQFLLNSDDSFRFASLAYDFKYWGLSTDHILETDKNTITGMKQIVTSALTDFNLAKKKYGQDFIPSLKKLETFIYQIDLPYSFRSVRQLISAAGNFSKRNDIKKNKFLLFILICKAKGKRAMRFIYRKFVSRKNIIKTNRDNH